MDVLNQQAKLGALKRLSSSYKAPRIDTGISSRVKTEEDPDYKRKQKTALTGKIFTPTKAPKTPTF